MAEETNSTGGGVKISVVYFVQNMPAGGDEAKADVIRQLKEFARMHEEKLGIETNRILFSASPNPCRNGVKWCPSTGEYIPCSEPCP
jgi:hypothetical protein